MRKLLVVVALAVLGCSSTGGVVEQDATDVFVAEMSTETEAQVEDVQSETVPDILRWADLFELRFDETREPDLVGPACNPGEGCFLDKCDENSDCQSGWCVDHMGDGVCSTGCQEECPPGWSCQQVAGTEPDVVYVCVSDYANLCKPCSGGESCKSVGGAEDVCVDYGDEGSFCGGGCTVDEDCPWGFSCLTTVTVDGIGTLQCVADAGVCPCTERAVELGLWTPCQIENEYGLCVGKRVCTGGGLSACDAGVAGAETCNGLDDDCDGEVDEPNAVEGSYIDLCDDQNECTADACLGEAGCDHESMSEGECKDGDTCTVGDHCTDGMCAGSPVQCDDDNPCTDDSCDGLGGCSFEHNVADCDDGDPCTVADECNGGLCAGVLIPCECMEDSDCQELEDGDLCNGTLVCNTEAFPHKCEVDVETIVTCPVPAGEQAACLTDFCEPLSGSCSIVPDNDGFACDDGDACTVGELCEEGVCGGGVAALCDDKNPCTDDSCDGATGCANLANDDLCSDFDVCTVGDYCAAGECVSGEELLCDDGNSCTADVCDAGKGCLHTPTDGECDDGNACTVGDTCEGTQCVAPDILDCDDGNICTTDGCSPLLGCLHGPSMAPCDDGNVCSTGDHCTLAGCVATGSLTCNDDNPCTTDSCDADVGCLFEAQDGECDDGNACTLGDKCSQGKCAGGLALACDDDNICTTDSCDPIQGCIHALNQAPCDDGDVCTIGDHCSLGECIASGSLTCDDSNACTDDSCAPEAGCSFTPNVNPCDDSNACTEDDACSGGQCKPGKSASCDDDNLCTDDYCDFEIGCLHVNNKVPCDDGDKCTANEECLEGTCQAGVPVVCSDGELCTDDSCAPDVGCIFTNNALVCDDGLACTDGDVCGDGACQAGGVTNCDDSKVCTDDSCEEPGGCLHTPVQDGTDCGGGKECQEGECVTACEPTSMTYSYTGGVQTLNIPGCASKVTLETWGAEGATNGVEGSKGKGGYTRGESTSLAGKTLSLYVGGKGTHSGTTAVAGWNGGGGHHGGNWTNGGGGGSDVRVDGTGWGNRIIVAGGGGGSAWCYSTNGIGGHGGTSTGGDAGHSNNSPNGYGRGGTQSAGGLGGTFSNKAPNGSLGTGANAYNDNGGCGGAGAGGGGYYGGGAGAHGGGGGGGSSFVGNLQNTTMQQGVRSGHGQVKVSWE